VDLLDVCQKNPIGIDVFRDMSGTTGLALFAGGQFFFVLDDGRQEFDELVVKILLGSRRKAIYDLKKLQHLGLSPVFISKIPWLYDIKTLFGGGESIFALAKKHLDENTHREMIELDQRFSSHVRSAKTVGIDLTEHSMLKLIPGTFVQKMLKLRCHASLRLLDNIMETDLHGIVADWENEGLHLTTALMEIEQNRIKVDVKFVEESLQREQPPHLRKYFTNISLLEDDGFVHTRFVPYATRTYRIGVDGTEGRVFNPLAIPKGVAREAIVSRHPDGEIYSIDLNAVDYRCIVASVDDPTFRERYESRRDFHMVNCLSVFGDQSRVTPELRSAIKALTYISIYGGSIETAAERSGLSEKNVRRVIEIFDRELAPVHVLRTRLYESSQRSGYVELPDGRRILTEKDDHPGKVLGLYAQGYSSLMFNRALVRIVENMRGRRSVVLFTVHDEVVLDVHPEETDVPSVVLSELQRAEFGWNLVAEISKGKNYRDATE
jgi:hypothetical protein